MEKRIKCFFMLFLLLISITKVNALSVSKNNLTIEKGSNDNVELYANTEVPVSSVTFTLVYSTYDIPANFYVNQGYRDTNPSGIVHNVIFDEPKSGKILLGRVNINVKNFPNDNAGSISINTANAKTEDGTSINLNNQTINVTIGTPIKEEPIEEVKEIDKNLLDKIESKLVKINITKDVFEYTVTIDKDIKELDLKPIAKDKDTKIDIKTQKIAELTDNKLLIDTELNGTKQTYTLNIIIKENKEMDKSIIDKGEFKENKSYKGKWVVITIVLIIAFIANILLNKKK